MQTVSITSGTGGAKKAILVCLWLLCAGFAPSWAAGLSMAWDPSPDTAVAGYNFYYGVKGTVPQKLTLGKVTSAAVSTLEEGKVYEFYVTARDVSGAQSDPSNKLTYTVPAATAPSLVTLTIEGFKDGYVQVSPRGSGPAGNQYAVGTQVSLQGTPKVGATFASWTINGTQYPANPLMLTLNADIAVTPNFKVTASGGLPQDPIAGPSMKIGRAGTLGVIQIGGEVGAWVLERSSNLTTWAVAAEGMTSDTVTVDLLAGNAFFRVRARTVAN